MIHSQKKVWDKDISVKKLMYASMGAIAGTFMFNQLAETNRCLLIYTSDGTSMQFHHINKPYTYNEKQQLWKFKLLPLLLVYRPNTGFGGVQHSVCSENMFYTSALGITTGSFEDFERQFMKKYTPTIFDKDTNREIEKFANKLSVENTHK